MNGALCGLVLGLALLSQAAPGSVARADGLLERFRDPEDGMLDMSSYLLERKGALPVPLVITEPAVGYGGGVALVFFQQSIAESAAQSKGSKRYTPPNVYGAGGMLTENGTWGAGGGGLVSFAGDRWRWRGGAGYADANLDFYGVGGNLGLDEFKVGYNLTGWGTVQHILRRIGESDAWLVGRWFYLDVSSSFDLGEDVHLLDPIQREDRNSGIGASVEFDSRDNIFTPNRGWTGSVDTLFYSPDWGSDTRFQSYRAHVFAYFPFAERFVLGLRADGRTARGDVPFYQLPFVDMRGIPAMRYQDENTAVVEAELRWNVTPRWSLIGFVGGGRAWGSEGDFSDTNTRVAEGAIDQRCQC